MRWWTPDPHPCIGGCGTILQHPWAKRCPKCKRTHTKVRYRERRERGVCVDCGKVPAFRSGLCEPHWERHLECRREYVRKAKAKKRRRDQKFVDCGVCGILIRKNGSVKYCGPCSVDRNGAWHERRKRKRLKEKGLCADCGKNPPVRDRVCCEECSTKKLGARRRTYHERKEKGLCTQCGKVPKGKTQMCEKCRRDHKLKDVHREIRKDG